MSAYEYAVVPAPKRGTKARGVKTTEDRFAYALQVIMNEYGAKGWEYVRSDTLPCEERTGLTGRTTTFQNVLVFRKSAAVEAVAPAPEVRMTETLSPPVPAQKIESKPLQADPARPEPRLAAE